MEMGARAGRHFVHSAARSALKFRLCLEASGGTNATTTAGFHYGGSPPETAVGFAVLLFGCVCFGTMFLPLKRVDCGDGFFVQFVECAAVFVFGFVVNVVRRLPKFNLIAALGGVLYATGNCASVPIIQSELGVDLGMLVWTTVQVVEGWGVGRFGLLGTHRQEVRSEPLNYAGIALSLLSGLLFVFVRSGREDEAKRAGGWRANFSRTKLLCASRLLTTNQGFLQLHWALRVPRLSARADALPVMYLQENDLKYTGNGRPSAFSCSTICSFFCGTFLFSTLYFVLYVAVKRGRPDVRPELVPPSVLYGVVWAGGMTSFLVANAVLSQTIT
ncbi:hypothetical protein M3Y99_01330500 [Aphelenchoides fujianensis]|nr:hypothetical protein M3Y99_01330500 [Aphelenchoides fujianensis]